MIDRSLQFLDATRINVGAILPGYTFNSKNPDIMYTMFETLTDSMTAGIPLCNRKSYAIDLENKLAESDVRLLRNCNEDSHTLEEYSDMEWEYLLSKLGYNEATIYPDDYDEDNIELIWGKFMRYKKDSLYDIARFPHQYIADTKPGYHAVVDPHKGLYFFVNLLNPNGYNQTMEAKSYRSPIGINRLEEFTPVTLSEKCKYKTITIK